MASIRINLNGLQREFKERLSGEGVPEVYIVIAVSELADMLVERGQE